MIKINITDQEKQILKSYFKTTPLILIRLKSQAILLRSKAMKIVDIADVLGRDARTIKRWLKSFAERRLGSLFTLQANNQHAAKLTQTQKEAIKRVLSQKPSDQGLPGEFWDVPRLKSYVWTKFSVVYESERSYHVLLEFGNLSFKVPDKFNVRRDEHQIVCRMKEIYREVMPYLDDPAWEVFCSDETRLQLEAETRRAWLRKGQKTVIKVERSNDYQNYLGFLNQKTFQCYIFEIAWGNQEEIIQAATEFLKLYPNKKICIIWDNATCHKGRPIRRVLAKDGPLARVHLVSLPPYAPDCNPIEHVWNTVKTKLANHQADNFTHTKQRFMALTNKQYFSYQM